MISPTGYFYLVGFILGGALIITIGWILISEIMKD